MTPDESEGRRTTIETDSAHHYELTYTDDGLAIRDMFSGNVVWIDGDVFEDVVAFFEEADSE